MSLYHHVKLLVSQEIGHWNRIDIVHSIERLCKHFNKTSEIKRILENARQNILSQNYSDANAKFQIVKNMENLEDIVKAEEYHFPIKKALVAAMTFLSVGLYPAKANAETPIKIQTNQGESQGYIRGNEAYDSQDNKIGIVENGIIKPVPGSNSNLRNQITPDAPNYTETYPKRRNGPSTRQYDNNNSNIPSMRYTTAKQYIKIANNLFKEGNYSECYTLAEEGSRLAYKSKIISSKKEFFDLEKIKDVCLHYKNGGK